MGKILAIDYGKKRTGLALSDEKQIFAFGHGTVETQLLKAELQKIIIQEKISKIVLGEPKRLNNEISETTEMVYQFKQQLTLWFPQIPVHLMDERYTSKMAQNSIAQFGLKKKRQTK